MSAHTLSDSATMLRRDFKHLQRYPVMAISGLLMPVFMMLLFVYVFGSAMVSTVGGGAYVDYLVPGILVMAVGAGSAGTAINVNVDMTEGIIARFRTMAISRVSVLTGQVVGSMIRTVVTLALVVAVALLIGFRPQASVGGWLLAAGVLLMLTLALTWLAVAGGLAAKKPEGANGFSLPFQFLPFLSSAFTPTDSMAPGLAWFAEHQPFTPIIDTLRAVLSGTPVGDSAWWAVGWCALGTAIGYAQARKLYNRDPAR
ncbi:ABC transporter permease [Actinosynnema sp. NPDC047251]|uniref:Transport permease protein n=1 Tax=Saccharothrix espanaensis (strain ATCC 51144 / DSM 44229 / JCM 9112 / NBRC 15066 / NRRL 15764) TaxID=1179773 RepID=K0K0E0_SACES|nr:ABC transporter permease [Saccharothrix espanaensis]CCH33705.1 Multidrug ABC transporter permease [Saccharothrix espanaensis DSM 44229]